MSASTAAHNAELHSLRCPRFRRWAHEAVDSMGEAVGYYVPAQLVDLLHILVNEPQAAAHIMPWLVGLEDRENA